MENLNSDEKMTILMNLSSNDIIKVCQTSKELSRGCGDVRYNALWDQKIKEDFNVNYKGNNAYEEYKRLYILLNTPIYLLSISYHEYNQIDMYNFSSIEKAKLFIPIYITSGYIDETKIAIIQSITNEVNNIQTNTKVKLMGYDIYIKKEFTDSAFKKYHNYI